MGYTAFDRVVAWLRFRAALPHLRAGTRVCDIGCGLDARFLTWAAPRIGFGVGLDRLVSTRGRPGVAIIRTDIMGGLPLRDSEFDHVVMLAVLEHLPQPSVLLREVFRILVPGGSFIITWPEPQVDHLLSCFRFLRLISSEMESEKHVERVPLTRLQEILGATGFERFVHRRFELGLNNLMVCYK